MISPFYKSPSLPSLKNNACVDWYWTPHMVVRQFSFNSTWSSFDFNIVFLKKSLHGILHSIASYIEVFNLVTQ